MISHVLNLLYEVGSYLTYGAVILFLQSFYDPDIKWNKRKALILGIISSTDYILSIFLPENLIITLIGSSASVIVSVIDCERLKFVKALKIIFTQFLFLISITNATISVSAFISPNYNVEVIETSVLEDFMTSLLYLLFFGSVFLYLRFRIAGKGLFIPVTRKETVFIICYMVYTLVLFVVTAITVENKVNSYPNALEVIMAINTIMLTVLLPVFIFRNRISEFFRESMEYQKAYIEAELGHFQQYKSAQQETRSFRHDIKNNLLCINDMLAQGKTEEAKKYLEALLGQVHSLSQKYVSGDEMLDSIIGSKAPIMEQASINFSMEGVIAGGLNIEAVDVCSIFANALDNAIEANSAVNTDERFIKITLKSTSKLRLIRISNPIIKNIDTKMLFKNGFTTKSHKKHHGIGTFNIKRTVEKYGGAVQAKCKDCMFTLEIVLPKQPLTTE